MKPILLQTVHHFESFARDSGDPPRMEDMRVVVGEARGDFEDVAALPERQRSAVLDPGSYRASQTYARALRDEGSTGVVYPSVRRQGGKCIGAFRPKAVGLPRQERHLKYRWDGACVDRYFDYRLEQWIEL